MKSNFRKCPHLEARALGVPVIPAGNYRLLPLLFFLTAALFLLHTWKTNPGSRKNIHPNTRGHPAPKKHY